MLAVRVTEVGKSYEQNTQYGKKEKQYITVQEQSTKTVYENVCVWLSDGSPLGFGVGDLVSMELKPNVYKGKTSYNASKISMLEVGSGVFTGTGTDYTKEEASDLGVEPGDELVGEPGIELGVGQDVGIKQKKEVVKEETEKEMWAKKERRELRGKTFMYAVEIAKLSGLLPSEAKNFVIATAHEIELDIYRGV